MALLPLMRKSLIMPRRGDLLQKMVTLIIIRG